MDEFTRYLVTPTVVAELCDQCWLVPVAVEGVDDYEHDDQGRIVLRHGEYVRLSNAHNFTPRSPAPGDTA